MLESRKKSLGLNISTGFPLGLAGAVAFFLLLKTTRGGERGIAQLFPKTVIYCKFNNFGTACRIGSIFEGKVREVIPDVPQWSTTPILGPKIVKR